MLAALRAGVETVLIPKDNEKDLADIPDNVKCALNIIPVSNIDEVLTNALVKMPEKIEWSLNDEAALSSMLSSQNNPLAGEASTH